MAELKASDGVNLYVERFDPEAGASGVPIVFSCAYSTTHVHWHSQVEAFVAAGHRVGLWDYRGHGCSESPADPERYSMEQVVSDLGRVMDWLAPGERCVLGGLSFGGLASLHMTRTAPERVRALVLADTGPGFKNPEAAEEWKQRREHGRLHREAGLRGLCQRKGRTDVHRTSSGVAGRAGGLESGGGSESRGRCAIWSARRWACTLCDRRSGRHGGAGFGTRGRR